MPGNKIVLAHFYQHGEICEAFEICSALLQENVIQPVQAPLIAVVVPAKHHIDLVTAVFRCHVLILCQSHLIHHKPSRLLSFPDVVEVDVQYQA